MGSLVDTCKSKFAAAVFVAAVVVVLVSLSILLLYPTDWTEVEGDTCDIIYGVCWLWPFFSDPDANCKENCLKLTDEKYEYYDGRCRPSMSARPTFPECFCCRKERSRAERESL